MGVPKRLTEMQRKFAEILVFGDKDGRAVTKTAVSYTHLRAHET